MTRRTLLGVVGLGALGPARAARSAQAPARAKGPRVWLDLDQQELDAAYDQRVWAPNQAEVQARYASASEAARARLGPPRSFKYGKTTIERLDVFTTDRPDAPIHLFVHGGAWRGGAAKDYAFLAELFVRAGAHLAIPDFTTVQDAGGSLVPMADQVRRALLWVHAHARTFGGNPDRLYVSGHSSGGHLAAVALTTDWARDFGGPADLLKGGVCSSGMYDLKPVRLSARSSYVAFTDEIEAALSPQRHLDQLRCPIVVSHGSRESPEFQRQARDVAAAVRAAGKPVQLVVGAHYNHFEMLETMASPYGVLGRAVLEQMHL
jgi:arylformamidase